MSSISSKAMGEWAQWAAEAADSERSMSAHLEQQRLALASALAVETIGITGKVVGIWGKTVGIGWQRVVKR